MSHGKIKSQYAVNFKAAPPIVTSIWVLQHTSAMVTGVEPYTRKDGVESSILHWKYEFGRIGTSGLNCAGITWQRVNPLVME